MYNYANVDLYVLAFTIDTYFGLSEFDCLTLVLNIIICTLWAIATLQIAIIVAIDCFSLHKGRAEVKKWW